MLHTLHIVADADHARLRQASPKAWVTATSAHQWSAFPDQPPIAVVPHGVRLDDFPFQPKPSDYLCFFGRFTPGKGVLEAIASARRLGLRLLLSGPLNDYYRQVVAPQVDGQQVEYVGAVNGEARARLLGGARALLYPIREPEAFGLVMVEAMLCGAPVAALGLGAVPEIVEEGLTGAIAEPSGNFDDAVLRALTLNRKRVRQRAEQRFSGARMAQDYLQVYEALCAERATGPQSL
jgi:glycosyltransferase involved in cell wall biosynthesis